MLTDSERMERAASNATLAVTARVAAVLMSTIGISYLGWSALTISQDAARILVLEHSQIEMAAAVGEIKGLVAKLIDEKDLKLRDQRMDQIDKRQDAWQQRLVDDEERLGRMFERVGKLEDILRPVGK